MAGGFAGVSAGNYGLGTGSTGAVYKMPTGITTHFGPAAPQGSWSGGKITGGRLPATTTAQRPAAAPAPPRPPAPSPGPAPTGGGPGGGSVAGATPYGSAGSTASEMAEAGGGLLDPNSEMGQRYIQELQRDVGKSTDAAERAAAYRAVMSGVGAGASPELLQAQTELGTAGLEAAGEAEADYRLKAPQLGAGLLGTTLGAQTAMRGQDLESRIAQQRIALEREQGAASTAAERDRMELERELERQRIEQENQRLAEQSRLQELGYLYGMF